MRGYFKIYFKEGVFFEHDPGGMRLVSAGGNDQIFAITICQGGYGIGSRKAAVAQYLNRIVPLAATEAGSIAVEQIGFNDYATFHDLHPNG